ncbi:MAG: zinc ribbon domain-containing protein [Bacteroidaceae bacterium]|nr:zinc ribbon domain-containing protein [Bacteroidaceae bacterium]
MRCKNCGWPNKPNERTCVKCHTPLDADESGYSAQGAGYTPQNQGGDAHLNKTVMESEVFGTPGAGATPAPYAATVPEQSDNTGGTSPCPKCGYPVRQGMAKCPNCNFSQNGYGQESSSYSARPAQTQPEPAPAASRQSGASRQPTRMNGGPGDRPLRGTVNPYMMNVEVEPTFILRPIKRMNERHDLDEMEYEGKSVTLNRDNTEANNPSITSREQAVITREGESWFIEDHSEQRTTFVQAAKRIELHDGDIILLGNRMFEFHE